MDSRLDGIYSTDAPAALGVSKYRTPVQVWLEKIGQDLPADEPEREEVQMGHVMQPIIGRLYEQRTGRRVRDLDGVSMQHSTIPWMRSHFDFEVAGEKRLVEAKNFAIQRMREFGEDGSGDVPWDCLVQCIHEAAVYQVPVVDLAVLFGGQRFRIFEIEINQEVTQDVIDQLGHFWDLVQTKTPPPPLDSTDCRLLYPKGDEQTVIADASIEAACIRLSTLRDQTDKMLDAQEGLKLHIQAAMGEHSILRSRDGTLLATWKKAKDSRVLDTKALLAQMPGIYEQYCVTRPGSRRFLPKDLDVTLARAVRQLAKEA